MRILQIAPPWFSVPPVGYGGIECVVAQLANGLVDTGHDVTLLAAGGSRTRATLWSVFDEPPSKALGQPEYEVRHWMRAYATRGAFDVVHDHSSIVGAALATVAGGPPVVHTVHGEWTPALADAYLALPPVLHLVALSQDHARRAPEGLTLSAVIPNGIDLERFPYAPARRPGAPYLAFVGRANADKGPDVAIQVARRTGRQLRMALKVNQPDECDYFDTVLRPMLGSADVDLILNGSAAQAAAVLAGAEATLMPLAWDEPFGLVLAESLACGTPVVAFARGAAPEIVVDGVTGFLLPPGDVSGLCAAVDACTSLSRARCHDHVRRHFSADAMVSAYDATYRRVVDAARPQLQRVARRVLAGVRS